MRGILVSIAALVAGCSCGIDSTKIDELGACSDDADCPSWRRCDHGYCVDRPCETAGDCGPGGVCGEDGYCGPAGGCQADAECDDGEFCNGAEVCADGDCEPGDAVDCTDLDDDCSVGLCNETTDACVAADRDDDGDGHQPTACGGTDCDDARDDVSPDATEGEAGPEDATCTDGIDNDCDGPADADDTGCIVCDGPEDCDDLNPCTDDACAAPRCVNAANDGNVPVDDGASCTEERCEDGVAVREPIDGACADASDCTTETCDPEDGGAAPGTGCVTTPLAASEPCDDAEACTIDDACDGAGACVAGALRDADSDGFADDVCGGTDCDDGDRNVRPDLVEGETGPEDATCSNAVDDDCDDAIDVADTGCVACDGPEDCVDAFACTNDSCDGVQCSNAITAGQCLIGAVCYAAGAANPLNPCQECTPATSQVAWANNTDACDDGVDCTHTDTCDDGACNGTGYSCADGLACTSDVCDGDGGCANPIDAASCLVAGTCRDDGELDPGNPCRECDPGTSHDAWTNDDANVPDDDFDCTTDACAAGVESHVANDGACGGGEVCAPCAGTADGCVAIPTVSVSCDPGTPGEGTPCTVDLGEAGQASCLACTSTIGMTSLVLEDFTGCPDLDAEGWTVTGSPVCPEDVAVGPASGVAEGALEAENRTWTIERYFDTTDFDQVRLCFDHADNLGSGADYIQALVDTGAGFTQIYFEPGSPAAGSGSDNVWHTLCFDLDTLMPASADNPDLGIRLTGFSGGAGRNEYLDRVALDAWDSGYVLFPAAIVSSDFAGCSTAGWAVGGPGAPICNVVGGAFNGRAALEADNNDWTLSRDVDASDLCEDIWVNFTTGVSGTDANDVFELSYDPGGGYSVVWSYGARPTQDGVATGITFSLSHRDPDVRFDPALGVRFRLDSNGGLDSMILDDVVIRGATCEPGDDLVSIDAPFDAGGGDYTFDVTSDVQTSAFVECTWDGRAATSERARVEILR